MKIILIAVALLVTGTVIFAQIRQAKKKSSSPCGCGCCGSSSANKNTSENSASSIKKLVLDIEGMHCVRCQNGVSEALNSLDGVSATVNLEKNCAFVDLSRDVSEDKLKNAVSDRGFNVTAIRAE